MYVLLMKDKKQGKEQEDRWVITRHSKTINGLALDWYRLRNQGRKVMVVKEVIVEASLVGAEEDL